MIENIAHKNTSCDIYVGKNAGTQLKKDLNNAQESIKILSPFISKKLLENLVLLQEEKEVKIELYTTFEQKKYFFEALKTIILQDKVSNNTAIIIVAILKIITGFSSIGLAIFCISNLSNFFQQKVLGTLFFLVFLIIILVIFIKNIKTYLYDYIPKISFKVFRKTSPYLHSKLYVIDDTIAYLGSANFTNAGLTKNYESIIRNCDQELIIKFNTIFIDLEENELPFYDIADLGKLIYEEQ